MTEYAAASPPQRIHLKQDFYSGNEQYATANSIFFNSDDVNNKELYQKHVFPNRNLINSIPLGKNFPTHKDSYATTSAKQFNDRNYIIPSPQISQEEIRTKRNISSVFQGIKNQQQEKPMTEKQGSFKQYNQQELKQSNDLSVYKRIGDPDSHAHHHNFDALNLQKNNTKISHYNQNFSSQPKGDLQTIEEKQRVLEQIDKIKADSIQFGEKNRYPESMKSETMHAYKYPDTSPRQQQQFAPKQIPKKLILGSDQIEYESAFQNFYSPQFLTGNIYPKIPTSSEVKARRKTNFVLGVETNENEKKSQEQEQTEAAIRNNVYKSTKDDYKKRLQINYNDSTLLGNDNSYKMQSASKKEMPQHSPDHYIDSIRNRVGYQHKEADSSEFRQALDHPRKPEPVRSENQEVFQLHKNARPNKLSPERENWLRSSSWKFQELKAPDFVSMNKQNFASPSSYQGLSASKTVFQKNVEKNIFMIPEKQDYIFYGDKFAKIQSSNQELMKVDFKSVPNSLGWKLQDLKSSHFKLS